MTTAAPMPTEAACADLRSLALKLGDLALDQHQMGILAMNNIGDPLIVNPLVRFIQQINDDIFRVYEQLLELTNTEKVEASAVNLSENSGLSNSDFIRMDEQRSSRFRHEIGCLQDELQSLTAATNIFPRHDIAESDMCPASTVNAFTSAMEKRLFLLYAMVNGDEQGIPDLREVEQ